MVMAWILLADGVGLEENTVTVMCGNGCSTYVSFYSPESLKLPVFPRDLALIKVSYSDRQSYRAGLMHINIVESRNPSCEYADILCF